MKPLRLTFIRPIWYLIPFLVIGAALEATAAQTDVDTETLQFEPCEISDPSGKITVKAMCTVLAVPEDPSEKDGKKIQLAIAKIAARSKDKNEDPFTVIAGGPGQSAIESWPSVQYAFARIQKNRDIILIDQRGTGKSNKLSCPTPDSSSDGYIDPFKFDAELLTQLSEECRELLRGNPAFYTTSVAVEDLELVREALAIPQWNIYGVSYGTRVGLHYLRRYPERVRTMTLDAVVPPDVSLGASVPVDAERAFEQMLARCESDQACSEAYPELGQQTRSLIEALKTKPVPISFENFNTGKLETMEFTANHLTLTMRMLSYSSHGVSILPNMLREAYANNNFASFARQADMQANALGESLATGMHNAVICTEDEPYIDVSPASRTELNTSYLGGEAVDALRASCENWTPGIIDEDFRLPVQSDKPVLIFSGGADPVTPASNGERIAQTLSSSLHIVNPHQGHMQAVLGCAPVILANFVTQGSVEDLQWSCLERLQPEPFFVDANGPTP